MSKYNFFKMHYYVNAPFIFPMKHYAIIYIPPFIFPMKHYAIIYIPLE